MGASSVTGRGIGSAESPMRGVNFDLRKLESINAEQIANGIITNEEFEFLRNLRSNIQGQIDSIAGAVAPYHVIYVTPNGEFPSIKSAMDSITDSSTNNRYVIEVAAGKFIEETITMKPWVVVQGAAEQASQVQLQDGYDFIFDNNDSRGVGIYDLVFINSGSVVKYRGSSLKIKGCRFREGIDQLIDATDLLDRKSVV